jgi:hypothetical protein
MARSDAWEKLAMAQGDPKAGLAAAHGDAEVRHVEHRRRAPVWLQPPTSASGGTRASTSRMRPDGSLIIAPEDALVVGIDRGWSEGSKAAFLRTNTGLFIVLGGFKQGSHNEYGIKAGQQTVRKGDKLGRVLGSYGMIHLETYAAEDRKANSVWWASRAAAGWAAQSDELRRAHGRRASVSLVQTRQRHEALKSRSATSPAPSPGPGPRPPRRPCEPPSRPWGSAWMASGVPRPRTRFRVRSPFGRAARRRAASPTRAASRCTAAASAGSAGW